MRTNYWNVRRARTAAFCALAAVALSGQVQAKPDMDGAWKLSQPQVLLTPANGEPIPFTAQGRKTYEQNKAAAQQGKYSFDEVMSLCASPGMPRILLSPNQFKLFDRPGMVMFLFDWNRLFRQVDMRDDATIQKSKAVPRTGGPAFPGAPPGGPPGAGAQGGPPGAGAPGGTAGAPPTAQGDPLNDPATEALIGTQMGHARGRWEGDVLVIKTNELADYELIDDLVQTSDQLSLVERLRLKDKDTLEDRMTISDPRTFTKPWDVVLTYKRQPDEAMNEDVCLERRRAGKSPWPKPFQ